MILVRALRIIAVKYESKIDIQKTGEYNFSVTTDGIVILTVDNTLIIPENSISGNINISSKGKKNISCEYFQLGPVVI